MHYSKQITTQVFRSTISFRNLRQFLELLSRKESRELYFRVNFTLSDGSEYSYDSCGEILSAELDKNIEYISRHKVISFSIYENSQSSCGSEFRMYFTDSGYMTINRADADGDGMALQDSAQRLLGLKLEAPTLVKIVKSKLFDFTWITLFGATLLLFPNISNEALMVMVCAGALSFFAGIAATFSANKCKLNMDNYSDSFITRNRDSILLNGFSLIIGFLLGTLTN